MSNTKVLKCAHCNNEAVFHVRGEGSQYNLTPPDLLDLADYTITTWRILECALCAQPTLEETCTTYKLEIVGSSGELFPTLAKSTILYPKARTPIPLPNLPQTIAQEYTAALKHQDSDPNACAIYIGRTLEEICNHEKIKDTRLVARLDELIKVKELPDILATMLHQIRQIRNIGAHADSKKEVTEEDMSISLDFVETILEYLYIARAKIAALEARLKKTS